MRKITEVLRLKYELGLGQRQIARSCSIGLGTVHEYLVRAEKTGLTWPLPADWGEEQIQAALFGSEPARTRKTERAIPDFALIHEQRRKHKHVTLRLLWEEYLEANPDGYRYSRFCFHYQRWRGMQDVVLRQEYRGARSSLSTGPDQRFRSAAARTAKSDRHTCLSPCSVPVPIRLPKPRSMSR
jgi:transposase